MKYVLSLILFFILCVTTLNAQVVIVRPLVRPVTPIRSYLFPRVYPPARIYGPILIPQERYIPKINPPQEKYIPEINPPPPYYRYNVNPPKYLYIA